MIAVDTNVLIYAHRKEFDEHQIALELLTKLSESNTSWAMTWPNLYEFIRVCTHKKILNPPSKLNQVISVIENLLTSPSLRILAPQINHFTRMKKDLLETNSTGNTAFDAQIASTLIDNGVREIITNDGDFYRFKELRVTNPFQ